MMCVCVYVYVYRTCGTCWLLVTAQLLWTADIILDDSAWKKVPDLIGMKCVKIQTHCIWQLLQTVVSNL